MPPQGEPPEHRNEEWPPLATVRESPHKSNKDPEQPKIEIK